MQIKSLILGVATFLIVACGGGSDSDTDSGTPPPVGGTPPPPVTKAAAVTLLEQATFGTRLNDIDDVVNRGIEGWIDRQLNLSPSPHLRYYDIVTIADNDTWSQHVNAWWMRSIRAEDQLRQRVAFALSQILVIGQSGVNSNGIDGVKSLSNYYDVLLINGLGNYRNLIEAVTLNPVMGEYLSMLRNEKPNPDKNIRPDENYARELMQLFTIGLVELNLDGTVKTDAQGNSIPTYGQEEIEGFAHVFTGWTWSNMDRFKEWRQDRDLLKPMKAFPDYHDTGEKTLLNGVVLPAGQTPEQDLEQALDNIFNHPNVGPFISKQLIQKLVTSNPSNAYVQRVATIFNNNGSGIRGDMKAVVKAILMDTEARTGNTSADKVFGKVKEPLLRLTALWRAFDGNAANGIYDFRWVNNDFSQGPLQSPSVFNFFSPFYAPQGQFKDNDWVAPELQIHSEGTMAKMTNHLHWRVLSMNNFANDNPDADDILINITRERDLASDPEALLDHLNLLLLAEKMSPELRQTALDFMATYGDENFEEKAADAIGLIITSPEFAVQQ
ncbi:DUF1800 family protein [Kangiella sp. HZ709]|uniref:DUF1800 domain-containing protein n=1 Tax=Kangiella sp. HZ709 TaxID=2666328 RepID=UPI0012B045B1|nr:DUF1800 domain-containing protein [Kangiella sp. HZ709]MRX28715.1 DUF1800 family protein [Kangiella sp. HZ709]